MPIHNWTQVAPGIFHDFHSAWIVEIRSRLNGGVLPQGYYAMAEQVAGNTIPDVLTLQDDAESDGRESEGDGGLAVATAPPRTSIRAVSNESALLATRRRRITIRHTPGDRIVALLEIISPGNKSSRLAFNEFTDKAVAALKGGFHLQLIDLFPPGPFDPEGMHGALWSQLGGTYDPPPGKPLTLASYVANLDGPVTCYVEPAAAGSTLMEMPLFFKVQRYVNVPLEQTYMSAYEGVPRRWKRVIEGAP